MKTIGVGFTLVGLLGLIASSAWADDAADQWHHQQAQAHREREEWQRQCEQAQRDREQADRDRQAQQDWYNQQAQAQREREEWDKQQAQAQRDYDQRQQERAQKEWDDWQNQRAQAQADEWNKQQAQKAADDWQAHLAYQQSILDHIERVKQQRDEILASAYGTQPEAAGSGGGVRVPQPMKNPFLMRSSVKLAAAFPHLVENPFVGGPRAALPATPAGRLPQTIENPFVHLSK